MFIWLVVCNIVVYLSIFLLGMIIPTDFHIFQGGWNMLKPPTSFVSYGWLFPFFWVLPSSQVSRAYTVRCKKTSRFYVGNHAKKITSFIVREMDGNQAFACQESQNTWINATLSLEWWLLATGLATGIVNESRTCCVWICLWNCTMRGPQDTSSWVGEHNYNNSCLW